MSHLGGHVNQTNLEVGTLQFLVKTFDIKTLIDVGCSNGGMIKIGKSFKLDAYGIEGDKKIVEKSENKDKIIIHDFISNTVPKLPMETFDLGYSTEVLEHIDEEHVDKVLNILSKCRYVLYTAAPPKWPGFHHVNCQEHEYWLKKFNQIGFILDPKITKMCRDLSSMNITSGKRKQFVKHRVIFLRNTKLALTPMILTTSKPSLDTLYVGKYHEVNVPDMNVVQPKVPNHIFRSNIPLTAFIGTKEEAKKMLTNIVIE